MRKIKLPKKAYKGLATYCKKCHTNYPKCKHEDQKCFRAIIYIPGGKGSVRTKMLKAENYDEAVIEIIEFKNELVSHNYEEIAPSETAGNDYNIIGAIVKYNQYLQGDSEYAHLNKQISTEYRKELIGYCTLLAEHLKTKRKLERFRVNEVSKADVASFYLYIEKKYGAKTFNKCLNSIRGFFNFLIKIEEIDMKNPFAVYVPKTVIKGDIHSLTKDEFDAILNAVDTAPKTTTKGRSNTTTSMYFPWLKDGFKLLLLLGGRREEIVMLKWSDILVTENGVKFFILNNLKVDRILKRPAPKKYIPINADLEELLIELGMNDKSKMNEYVLLPERGEMTAMTIMLRLTKSFTYYKRAAGITKNITLKNLRKTYVTWVENYMGKDTGKLTSHATGEVIDKFYLDPTILSVVERGALEIKIFGENPTQNPTPQPDAETKKDPRFNVSP